MFEAVLIAGPTASGKSAAAVALAGRLGGTIINADSMQVYRELPVLTARPSVADMADFRLLDHLLSTAHGAHVNHVDAAGRANGVGGFTLPQGRRDVGE